MKQQIVQYVAECDVCQGVKAEHSKPAGTLQPFPIPKWKWEEVSMDFVTGLSSPKDVIKAVFSSSSFVVLI